MTKAENTHEGSIAEGLLGSFREKCRLALLLLHHRPLRVCSVVAPSHPNFLAKTADLGIFRQALSLHNGLAGTSLWRAAAMDSGSSTSLWGILKALVGLAI